MSLRDRSRQLLRVAGWVILFTGVMPSLTTTLKVDGPAEHAFLKAHPGERPGHTDCTFGWPASPLVHYHRETRLVGGGAELSAVTSRSLRPGFLSWSAAAVLLGVVLLVVARRRPAAPKPPTDVPTMPAGVVQNASAPGAGAGPGGG
jgi:hypothetical protein